MDLFLFEAANHILAFFVVLISIRQAHLLRGGVLAKAIIFIVFAVIFIEAGAIIDDVSFSDETQQEIIVDTMMIFAMLSLIYSGFIVRRALVPSKKS
ncbi:hypothetical protein M0Q28_02820 [Patescibacteria group bacterium]|jgi:hypothetical protein|nr:hypothetical protein [Patescibacteria group bacterium]